MYLERVNCEGDETLLLDCGTTVDLGLSDCDHSEDVGVKCYGMLINFSLFSFCLLLQTHTHTLSLSLTHFLFLSLSFNYISPHL